MQHITNNFVHNYLNLNFRLIFSFKSSAHTNFVYEKKKKMLRQQNQIRGFLLGTIVSKSSDITYLSIIF